MPCHESEACDSGTSTAKNAASSSSTPRKNLSPAGSSPGGRNTRAGGSPDTSARPSLTSSTRVAGSCQALSSQSSSVRRCAARSTAARANARSRNTLRRTMIRTVCSVRSATVTPVSGELRIATFNMLHGRSLDHLQVEEADLRAAAAAIDADVVGLQEVDRLQDRSSSLDQTAVVADALGAGHWRFVPALHGTPGGAPAWTTATEDDGALTQGPTYGVALVSRLPVREWHVRRFGPAPVAMPLMVRDRT